MGQLHNLTSSEVLLLAIVLATESDLQRLEILAVERQSLLTEVVLYRILLTFLPADIENQLALATFLRHLSLHFEGVSSLDLSLDSSIIEHIPEHDKFKRIEALRLNRIHVEQVPQADDDLANFLVQWTYQLEATSGLAPTVLDLLESFTDGRPKLCRWTDSYVRPLSRLQNEFYPGQADILNLYNFEHLQGEPGVSALLQFAEQAGKDAEIGRDLTEIVTPWIRGASSTKRRRLDTDPVQHDIATSWQSVNEWIFTISDNDFGLAAKAVSQWDGPHEVIEENPSTRETVTNRALEKYAQTILSIILNARTTKLGQQQELQDLVRRAEILAWGGAPAPDQNDDGILSKATKADLLRNRLIADDNPITYPSDASFHFITTCISVQAILETFTINLSMTNIADVALFGTEERQKQELRRILGLIPQLTRAEISWTEIHLQVLQLHGVDTENRPISKPSFLGRISREYLEAQVLTAMLSASAYQAVNSIYLGSASPILSITSVEDHIVTAIFQAYDNASNGNRMRGGMKRASDLLSTFRPHFQDATFARLDHLLRATHSMSFYQLTLQHGIPFQPVSIRVNRDPISLVEKILEQNPKAYTKLDDLIDIGQNLVKAILLDDVAPDVTLKTEHERMLDAEHRITYLATTSALTSHDFDTAYSYITTRLSTTPVATSSSTYTDDISWRAAYAAGKYRPQTTSSSIHDRIAGLSKRMDLLSSALMLAPNPEPLSEILATWRRLEEEMDGLRSQALEEERSLEAGTKGYGGTSELPGGFAAEDKDLDDAETKRVRDRRAAAGFSPTYEDAAPMGLFDVARGAASAFRNSAFPLGKGASKQEDLNNRSASWAGTGSPGTGPEYSSGSGSLAPARRKRDVVSGIVTGGLVSGMSWVLGAQPTSENKSDGAGNE